MDDSSDSIFPGKGLCAIVGGGILLWLSRESGREAAALSSVQRIKNLAELREPQKFENVIVAVSGRVESNERLESDANHIQCAIWDQKIIRFLCKYDIYSGKWKYARVVIPSFKEIPWFIEDGSGSAKVLGARTSKTFSLLRSSFLGQGLFVNGRFFNRGSNFYSQYMVERILPLGSQMTIVGEAIKDKQGNVTLCAPLNGPFYVSLRSLDSVIWQLNMFPMFCRIASIGCFLMGLYWTVKKVFDVSMREKRNRAIKERILQVSSDLASREILRLGVDDALSLLCVICCERRYSVVFLRCGHLCTCTVCSLRLRNCPLCRTRIVESIEARCP